MQRKTCLRLAAMAGLAVSGTAHGQFALVTNQPGTFTDISGTGTSITSGDDSSVAFTSAVTNALVASPNLYASTNGNITDSAFFTYTNTAMPVAGVNFGLFVHWDDLYVENGIGSLIHQNLTEGGIPVEIIQWNQVRTFAGGPGSATGSFEVKIFQSGPVLVQFIYQDVSFAGNGASATVGIQWNGTSIDEYTFDGNPNSIQNGQVLSVLAVTVGACCRTSGACFLTTGSNCTAQSGIYRGDNTVCANANCPLPPGTWIEVGEAGDFMESANITTGSGALNEIRGTAGTDDADMYAIQICTPGSFSASTVGGAAFDTQLFLFDASGMGVVADDDDPYGSGTLQSNITSLYTASRPAGVYFLAMSQYNKDPVDGSGQIIWANMPFGVERTPDGPGAANPIASWDAGSFGGSGPYTITLTGACYAQAAPASCYANCDSSTTAPCLNVLDFQCFLNQFAAATTYANCDSSTTTPVLNVLDFQCFLNRFAAGCSGC